MEFAVAERIGAGRHERSEARTANRNGYRERALAAVIQQAWVGACPPARWTGWCEGHGLRGHLLMSGMSELCQALDARVGEFLERPLDCCRTRAKSWRNGSS